MAEKDELELDTTKKKSGGKGKLIMIIVLVVLLTTGVLIGVLFFTGNLGGGGDTSKEAEADGSSNDKEVEELVIKPAFYYDLAPAFVVNFEDKIHAAYLQIEMQLMVRDRAVNDQIIKHMPVIRNNILLILSAEKFEEVKTRQGKEVLQAKVLQAVREIVGPAMKEELQKDSEEELEDKDVPNVEQVYFTSFIMQ